MKPGLSNINQILLLFLTGAVIFSASAIPPTDMNKTTAFNCFFRDENPAKDTSGNSTYTAHIDTLQYAGDEAINMAIASEGYTEDEMEKFRQEGEKLVKGLFSISPFDRFKGYFNLFLIRIPSAQSGISTPNHETDTPFKVRASGNGLDRLLVPDDIEACKRIADSLLGKKCDILCLAANFPDYGGAGGEITVVSGHYMATEILAHELGHSVGGLGDEYYSCEEFIGRFPNVALNAHDAPWIGIPGSGLYPLSRPDGSIAAYIPCQTDSSSRYCRMAMLGKEFCPVCEKAISDAIEKLSSEYRLQRKSCRNG